MIIIKVIIIIITIAVTTTIIRLIMVYSMEPTRESDWMSIQPLEVPDRQSFPAKLLSGGWGWGRIGELGRGGGGGEENAGPKKNLQI